MKKFFGLLLLLALPAFALDPGSAAPAFTATTSEAKALSLSDYKGKTVVLEWLNYGCPFVKKHYEGQNMQKLQADYTAKGVAWISIVSSAPGKQGFGTPADAEKARLQHGSKATAVVLDPEGKIGKLYGAKTTPHMFVIDPKGNIAYQGAIDDKPSTDPSTLKGAHNYVRDALDAVLGDRKPATAQTASYGCSVKYD